MKRLLLSAPLVALAVLLVSAPEASAFGWRRKSCAPDCAPTCVTWVDQVVVCYRTEWQSRDVEVIVQKPHYQEVVRKEKRVHLKPVWAEEEHKRKVHVPYWAEEEHKHKVLVPYWAEEERKVPVCRPVVREEERDVVRCRMTHHVCHDPCTGCSYTVCKPQTYVERVKCHVVHHVTTLEPVKVRVCRYREEEHKHKVHVCRHREEEQKYKVQFCRYERHEEDVDVKYVTCEWRPEKVKQQQHFCVRVPYQTVVKVPVCVPAAPAHCAH